MSRLATALFAAVVLTHDAQARLNVVNGDFSDLGGLSAANEGWYGGLPKGWQGTANTYAIHAAQGATPPTCNPSTLGFLRQNIGTVDKPSDITLSFDVSAPWKSDGILNAAILDAKFTVLASGDFKAGAKQTLVAKSVPAGTAIVLSFQATAGTPGLDNVSVKTAKAKVPPAGREAARCARG